MARKLKIAWSPIRDIMKEEGAKVVQAEAVTDVIKHLEQYVRDLTQAALKLARHSKRTKITKDDVKMILGGKLTV